MQASENKKIKKKKSVNTEIANTKTGRHGIWLRVISFAVVVVLLLIGAGKLCDPIRLGLQDSVSERERYLLHLLSEPEEMVDVAMSKIPDLIISDIMMPVKDGFTCCRELREQPRTAHIPILMLTAKAEDADVLQASKIGVDDYMMKPFNPEVLKAKVRNLILQRERLKRIYTKTLMLKQQESEPETDGNNAPDDFIQQIIHVIEANLANENFNVKMLAEQLNMSQPTLYRKIKQRSELSAIDMIRSVRMSKAASLIMENRYSIQEIAEMVGYSDTRTLRKHFTEQFGVSPSKYMEKD